MLTIFCLLSLGQFVVLKFVYFLSVLQSWADFLCVLTNHLQGLPLIATARYIQELAIECVCVCVCVCVSVSYEKLGVSMGQN